MKEGENRFSPETPPPSPGITEKQIRTLAKLLARFFHNDQTRAELAVRHYLAAQPPEYFTQSPKAISKNIFHALSYQNGTPPTHSSGKRPGVLKEGIIHKPYKSKKPRMGVYYNVRASLPTSPPLSPDQKPKHKRRRKRKNRKFSNGVKEE